MDNDQTAETAADKGVLVRKTSQIVAAYVRSNAVPAAELPRLIETVYAGLAQIGKPMAAPVEVKPPAVPIRRSVTPEHIVCLECGMKNQMLKRHLRTVHDMDPNQYRAKWGLPAEYPMVAPVYAEKRSAMAKANGLGLNRKRSAQAPAAPARRGQKRVPA